jgi:pimeloyl-ACP methyl ester carboxylesterase
MQLAVYKQLEYLDANPTAARVILVLHWGGASAQVGVPFAYLLSGWRVIAPSLRGHGRNPLPTASADLCGQDVLDLLDHLGITRVDRLYAYSVGGYVATRLFGQIPVVRGVLLAGGVVPFGIAMPEVFAEPETDQEETAPWLADQRASLTAADGPPQDLETEWATMLAAYEDIFDCSRPTLTHRLTPQVLRPLIESIWDDDYFARARAPIPSQLLFWNGNDPVACRPYIERFERHPGCQEVTLDMDPFDVRWSTVRPVIALLDDA